jgi:hypothetical protein
LYCKSAGNREIIKRKRNGDLRDDVGCMWAMRYLTEEIKSRSRKKQKAKDKESPK